MRMTRKQLRRLIENEVKVVTMTPEQEKKIKDSKESEAEVIKKIAEKEGLEPEDVKAGLEPEDVKEAIAEAVNRVILRSMLTESWSGANEQELSDVSEKKKKRKKRKRKSKKAKNWYLGSYYFRDNEDFNDFNDFDGGDGGGE